MEKPEGEHESRLDKELLEKIRASFAEKLEKKAAQSKTFAAFLGENIGERIICGEKTPRKPWIEMILRGAALDFHLKPEEMDELTNEFLGENGAGPDKRDKEFLYNVIRERFAEELEERAAQSKTWAAFLGQNIGERIINGEAVPITFGTEELLIKIAGELGLSQKEAISELKSTLLKSRE